jgi:hypothetical protein
MKAGQQLSRAEAWDILDKLAASLAREAVLREALENLVHHPAFDRAYISKELAAKLDAARAALALQQETLP